MVESDIEVIPVVLPIHENVRLAAPADHAMVRALLENAFDSAGVSSIETLAPLADDETVDGWHVTRLGRKRISEALLGRVGSMTPQRDSTTIWAGRLKTISDLGLPASLCTFSQAEPHACRYSLPMAGDVRIPLEVGTNDLSIGQYSVGFPPTRTSEEVIETYLELITLIRALSPEDLRLEDISTLARTTGLDESFILNRVSSHLAAARSAS